MAKQKNIRARLYITRNEGSTNYFVSCHPSEPSVIVAGKEGLRAELQRLASHCPSIFYEHLLFSASPYNSQEHTEVYGMFRHIKHQLDRHAQAFVERDSPSVAELEEESERTPESALVGDD